MSYIYECTILRERVAYNDAHRVLDGPCREEIIKSLPKRLERFQTFESFISISTTSCSYIIYHRHLTLSTHPRVPTQVEIMSSQSPGDPDPSVNPLPLPSSPLPVLYAPPPAAWATILSSIKRLRAGAGRKNKGLKGKLDESILLLQG